MPRQPHPELNFRMGKGRIRERRIAMTTGLVALMKRVGMTEQEQREFLERAAKECALGKGESHG